MSSPIIQVQMSFNFNFQYQSLSWITNLCVCLLSVSKRVCYKYLEVSIGPWRPALLHFPLSQWMWYHLLKCWSQKTGNLQRFLSLSQTLEPNSQVLVISLWNLPQFYLSLPIPIVAAFFFSSFHHFSREQNTSLFAGLPDLRQPLASHSPQCPLKQLCISISFNFQWIPIQTIWCGPSLPKLPYLTPVSYFYKSFLAAFHAPEIPHSLSLPKYARPPCLCVLYDLCPTLMSSWQCLPALQVQASPLSESLPWFSEAGCAFLPSCPLHHPLTTVRALTTQSLRLDYIFICQISYFFLC